MVSSIYLAYDLVGGGFWFVQSLVGVFTDLVNELFYFKITPLYLDVLICTNIRRRKGREGKERERKGKKGKGKE